MTPVKNPASNSKNTKLPTPAKSQLMKTHQSLTMTPVRVQMKKMNNPVITIPDNDDNVSFFSRDRTIEDKQEIT